MWRGNERPNARTYIQTRTHASTRVETSVIETIKANAIVIDRNVIRRVGEFLFITCSILANKSRLENCAWLVHDLWLTSSCAAPAAEFWYRKRVAASLRLSNKIVRKQRRDRRLRSVRDLCVRSSFCCSIPSRQLSQLTRDFIFSFLNRRGALT